MTQASPNESIAASRDPEYDGRRRIREVNDLQTRLGYSEAVVAVQERELVSEQSQKELGCQVLRGWGVEFEE